MRPSGFHMTLFSIAWLSGVIMLKRMNFYVYRKGKRVSKEKLVKKQKGMIITAAVLLAAAAVVTGSRLIRHPEKSNT